MAKRVALPKGLTHPGTNETLFNSQFADTIDDGRIDTLAEVGDPSEANVNWASLGAGQSNWENNYNMMDPECPPWLCDHVKEHDPACKHPSESKHYCDECCFWMDNWKDLTFPGGLIKPQTGRAQEVDVFGYNSFTNMCGLWTTPDFFAECCNYFDQKGDGIPRNVIEYSIAYASEILYKLSARQYPGMCERLVYPGCDTRTRLSPAYKDMPYQRDTDYADFGPDFWDASHDAYGALAFRGYSASCGCDNSCCNNTCNPSAITIPGPINNVIEIVIDGEVLPPSAYRIRANKELVRVDGGCWPKFNNLNRSPFTKSSGNITFVETKSKLPDWVNKYMSCLGENIQSKDDFRNILESPDWVENFLRHNPELVQNLPASQPWVNAWLGANGFELVKTTEECPADTVILEFPQSSPCVYPASQCCSEGPQPGNICCSGECADQQVLIQVEMTPAVKASVDTACKFLYKPDCNEEIRIKSQDLISAHLNREFGSAGGCHSWAIRYYQGKCAPLSGQLAAAALAKQIAEFICTEQCLPKNTRRIVAEGVDIRFSDRFQRIYSNFPFGIPEVDYFLGSVNPNGLQRSGYAARAGYSKKPKVYSLR